MPEQPADMPELLLPAPPETPRAQVQEAHGVPQERRRPSVLALALLAVGFGLALSAQYMPWSIFTYDTSNTRTIDVLIASNPGEAGGDRIIEQGLAFLSGGHVLAYLMTMALALTAIGVLIAAGGAVRRIATAGAFGLLAANLLVLVGMKPLIDRAGSTDYAMVLLTGGSSMTGPGYLLALAAVVVLAAGVLLAARDPRTIRSILGARRRDAGEPDGGAPLELTVTPVPPTLQ